MKISDEIKAGIISGAWLIITSCGLLSETAVGYVVSASATIIFTMIIAFSAAIERMKQSCERDRRFKRQVMEIRMKEVESK